MAHRRSSAADHACRSVRAVGCRRGSVIGRSVAVARATRGCAINARTRQRRERISARRMQRPGSVIRRIRARRSRGMFEREEIQVDLYCNYPRNGLFAGQLWALKVGPNMEFGSKFIDWGPRLRFLDGRIAIAGKHFPITCYREWVGNWCWDAVRIE